MRGVGWTMREDQDDDEAEGEPGDSFEELSPFWRGVLYGALGDVYYSWYDEP